MSFSVLVPLWFSEIQLHVGDTIFNWLFPQTTWKGSFQWCYVIVPTYRHKFRNTLFANIYMTNTVHHMVKTVDEHCEQRMLTLHQSHRSIGTKHKHGETELKFQFSCKQKGEKKTSLFIQFSFIRVKSYQIHTHTSACYFYYNLQQDLCRSQFPTCNCVSWKIQVYCVCLRFLLVQIYGIRELINYNMWVCPQCLCLLLQYNFLPFQSTECRKKIEKSG